MDCSETSQLIDGYLDGELDLNGALTVEKHCEECVSCAATMHSSRAVRSAVQNSNLYFQAPPGLRHSISAELAREEPRKLWLIGLGARFASRWVAAVASLSAAALLALALVPQLLISSNEQLVRREVIDSHVRALMTRHLTDVESSDHHTVKPWFDGRLDFSPAVEDLSAAGFPLAGGRLEYIAGRAVATLVYHRRQHVIDVFVWPSTRSDKVYHANRNAFGNGYDVVRWRHGGMEYWAVSNLNAGELAQFAALMTGAAP